MDWFPLQLWRSKCAEVVRISSATLRSRQEVLGYLTDLWSYASSESDDGFLRGISMQNLVNVIGADESFWLAVRDAGWLVVDANYLQIPNWDNWLSKSAKRRTREALRKSLSRSCPQNVRKMSASKADKKRQYKRGEDIYKKPPYPLSDSFAQFWSIYPNHKAKADALKAWTKLNPDDDLTKAILSAIAAQKQSEAWTKDGGRFIPLPATWIRGRRWEDEIGGLAQPARPRIPTAFDMAHGMPDLNTGEFHFNTRLCKDLNCEHCKPKRGQS